MSKSFQTTRKVALQRADYECAFCGVADEQHRQDNGSGLDVHHVLPRSAGGSDEPSNLLAVCRSCHKTLEHSQGAAMKEVSEMGDSGRVKELESKLEDSRRQAQELEKETHILDEQVMCCLNFIDGLLEASVSFDISVCHTSKIMTSELLYAGTDEKQAFEKYSAEGSHSTLEHSRISIEQVGGHITENELQRVFDRSTSQVPGGTPDYLEKLVGPNDD